MRRLLRDASIYLAAVLVLGTSANLIPRRHLAWWGKGQEPPQAGADFTFVDPGSADTERTSLPRAVFLDTRSAAEFSEGHIPGAVRLSYTDLDLQWTPAFQARLRAADAVVIYGASEETDVEQLAAQELHQRGLPPPQVLAGGFPAWQAAGLPIAAAAP